MDKRWIRDEQAKREDVRTASQSSLATKDKRAEGQSRSINSLQRYCDLHTPHGYGGYTVGPGGAPDQRIIADLGIEYPRCDARADAIAFIQRNPFTKRVQV